MSTVLLIVLFAAMMFLCCGKMFRSKKLNSQSGAEHNQNSGAKDARQKRDVHKNDVY